MNSEELRANDIASPFQRLAALQPWGRSQQRRPFRSYPCGACPGFVLKRSGRASWPTPRGGTGETFDAAIHSRMRDRRSRAE